MILRLGMVLALLAGTVRAEEAGGAIDLTVRETAGIRRFGYPVHATVSLPREMSKEDRFRLLEGKKPAQAQFRSLANVGKKSAVALDFNVSLGPYETKTYRAEYGPRVEGGPEPKAGLLVEETKETITVRSGGMSYTMRRDLLGLLHEVRGGKVRYLKPGSPGLTVVGTNRKGVALSKKLGAGQLRVTRAGPLTIALRGEEMIESPAGNKIPLVIDFTFPRSKSWVEIDIRARGGKEQVLELRSMFDLEIESKPTLVDFGASTVVYTTLTADEGAKLAIGRPAGPSWTVSKGKQDTDWQALVVAPRNAKREQVEGWMHLMDSKRCTAIAVAEFGAKGQIDSMTALGSGLLTIGKNFAAVAEPGERRLRFWMHFVSMPVQVGAVTSPQSMMAPLTVEVKPR